MCGKRVLKIELLFLHASLSVVEGGEVLTVRGCYVVLGVVDEVIAVSTVLKCQVDVVAMVGFVCHLREGESSL